MCLPLGAKKCHISNVKRTFVIFTEKNLLPAYVKPIALKAGLLLLCVSPAWRAIFLMILPANHHDFHQTILKRVTLENPSFLLANTNRVLVQDLSSKTGFLRGNGQ